MELKSGKNRMVEAEEREWVCWILLVRLMFVLFLGLLLMWYWCVQATLCVFSWRVRISLCNFKRCDILGLNTQSLRSCSATVSALRGIPASCALEFASEFSAGVFPFVPPKPGIFVMQTSSSVSFSLKGGFFLYPFKRWVGIPSLVNLESLKWGIFPLDDRPKMWNLQPMWPSWWRLRETHV